MMKSINRATVLVSDLHDEARESVERALASLKAGQEVVGIEIKSLEEELKNEEWFASLNLIDGKACLFATVHHDTDVLYEASLESFDVDDATAELFEDIMSL